MFEIKGKSYSFTYSEPLAPQVKGLLTQSLSNESLLEMVKEIHNKVKFLGTHATPTESAFYDFWEAIRLFQGFLLDKFITQLPEEALGARSWDNKKGAPEGEARRSAIKLALELTLENINSRIQ
ncbi:MAG: hypothetical protein RLZZ230_214 [Candidatus Parcubacteria bacterium]